MLQPEPGHQANTEYFFRLLYEWIYGQHATINTSAIQAFLAKLWLWIIAIGYTLSVIALFIIIYTTVKLFELRKREEHELATRINPESQTGANPRWEHIQSLAHGGGKSELREAIIEADIMLDDALARRGYMGDGLGDKLKTIDQSELGTIQDAWEAHKVRNQIAHQGSAFELSESVAQRTLARFEAVFRELGEI